MSGNIGTIINYVNFEAEKLTKLNERILFEYPMSTEITCSIVIPVYNEGGTQSSSNIFRTLIALANQTVLKKPIVKKYEIIIVNNNSTDNTLELLHDFHSLFPKIPFLVISQKKKGYSIALKTGLDFAVRRFLNREVINGSIQTNKIKFTNHFLAVTDADSPEISPTWIKQIMELGLEESISCFGGPMPLAKVDVIKFPNIAMLLDRYQVKINRLWEIFGGQTPGANMGFRPFWYCIIGGVNKVFNLPYGMDVHMGNKILALGGKITMLPSDAYVCFNLRRVLNNPMSWLAGKSYDSGMNDIRDRESEIDLPIENVEAAWQARKKVAIEILLKLILMNPSTLFSNEQKFSLLFKDKVIFEKLKITVLKLLSKPLFRAYKILFLKFSHEIEI